jgi:hypothetical protein
MSTRPKEILSLRDTVIVNDHLTPKLTDYLFENCLTILNAPDQSAEEVDALRGVLGWRQNGPDGFLSKAAMRADPTESLSAERIIAFAMLPCVVGAAKERFYPERIGHGSEQTLSAGEMEKLIRRAWMDEATAAIIYH